MPATTTATEKVNFGYYYYILIGHAAKQIIIVVFLLYARDWYRERYDSIDIHFSSLYTAIHTTGDLEKSRELSWHCFRLLFLLHTESYLTYHYAMPENFVYLIWIKIQTSI